MTKQHPTTTLRSVRERQRTLADALRNWREDRRIAALKRRAEERKTRKQARAGQSTGVDRVPAHLRGLHLTIEPYDGTSPVRTNADGTVRRGGHSIDSQSWPAGNYETRRARGQRGKPRRPRRREIRDAGAVNRLPDSALVVEREATRRERDKNRGRQQPPGGPVGAPLVVDGYGTLHERLDRAFDRVGRALGRTGRAG